MSQAFPSLTLSRVLIIVLDVLLGMFVGAVLAFVTALLLITAHVHAMQTTVNGWSITMTFGKATNGILRLGAGCPDRDAVGDVSTRHGDAPAIDRRLHGMDLGCDQQKRSDKRQHSPYKHPQQHVQDDDQHTTEGERRKSLAHGRIRRTVSRRTD